MTPGGRRGGPRRHSRKDAAQLGSILASGDFDDDAEASNEFGGSA
ncbi:hypothetical protein [Corallococcus sp. EGB]|nr:hypothetical protein [Corallococcus sp. EGB]